MLEHITVFTKEEITQCLAWPLLTLGGVLIAMTLVGLIIYVATHKDSIASVVLKLVTFIGLPLLVLVGILCDTCFAQGTGRYQYSGVVDEEVSMVEFYDAYTNVSCQDGVWYWEDK